MLILKLHDHFPMRVTDWLLSGILLSWGLGCLYLPQEVWELPIYAGLRRVADQATWGTFASVIGLVRMTALFVNGAIRRSPHTRMLGAFLTGFLWLQLSFGMFVSDTMPLEVAIYPWLFCAEVFNVYRAAQDARLSDARAVIRRRATPDAPAP